MIKIVISILFVLACIVLLYRFIVAAYWHVQGVKLRRNLDKLGKNFTDVIIEEYCEEEIKK